MREVLERLRGCNKLIAVGDLVCYSMMVNNVTPDICVIDGKTKRTYGVPEISEKCFSKVLENRRVGEGLEGGRECLEERSESPG